MRRIPSFRFYQKSQSLLILTVFILVASGSVRAQVLGSISGAVQDISGALVPGATVTVRNVDTGVTRNTTTGSKGDYNVSSIAVGNYEVRAEKEGFQTEVRSGITLAVGQQAVVNLTLQVGETRQEVTVSGEAPLVSVTTSSIAGLVGERQVKDLPLNGRSFDQLLTLNPSTVNTTVEVRGGGTGHGQGNTFSVAGTRDDFNLWLLNGIEYTGESSAVPNPGGISGQLLGVDAVREFNVVAETYGAEYGKRAGGQVSIVTMSGTNQFHGDMFEFLRNSDLDARNFFDHTIGAPPFKRNQFGSAAGGPIQKDKTFIFGNYEGFRQRLAGSYQTLVPDANARNGLLPNASGALQSVPLSPAMVPYLALWPLPNGPEAGGGAGFFFSNPSQSIREDFGNIRVDRTFSTKDTLSGIYTIDDGLNLTPEAIPGTQQISQLRSQVLSAQEVHVFSPTVLSTFSAGYSRARWDLNAASPTAPANLSFVAGEPLGVLSIGGSGVGASSTAFGSAGANGSQQSEVVVRNLFTVTDQVQISKGIHMLSVGAWFQRVRNNDLAASQPFGTAAFPDLAHLLAGQSSGISATLNTAEVPWRQFLGAWWVQDAIKVRPNLTINVGLRHDFNNGWNSSKNLASNFIFDSNGVLETQPRVSHSVYTTNNARWLFGPRVAVAWAPFGNNKTALRAGYGIYYNEIDYMGNCCENNPVGPYNNSVTIGSVQQPVQFPLVLASGQNLPGVKIAPIGVQPTFFTPSVQEYSFKIERSITNNNSFSVGYVGSHGVHLPVTLDVNPVAPTTLPSGQTFFPANAPFLNPNLAYTRYLLSEGNSSYNALQTDFTQRLSHGLQFRANYTYSKILDSYSTSFLGEGAWGVTSLLDPFNTRLDWGRATFDARHRFVANLNYELPFGAGRTFLHDSHGVKGVLISGWQINGIISKQSGFPFMPTVGFNQSRDGDARNPDRPNWNPNFTGPIILGTPQEYFNPNAFVLPAAGTFGDVAKGVLHGPGLAEADISMFKTTRLTEQTRLEFRAEFFNLFNSVNFTLPTLKSFNTSGTIASGAGLISSTTTTSRQIQFALKFIW